MALLKSEAEKWQKSAEADQKSTANRRKPHASNGARAGKRRKQGLRFAVPILKKYYINDNILFIINHA